MDCEIYGKAGMPQPNGNILILSGESGSGKTTLCMQLVEKLKKAHLQVLGVVCPPVIENGEKTGIDLVDLESRYEEKACQFREKSGMKA